MQSKKKISNVNNFFYTESMSYAFFITTFILSIYLCVCATNQCDSPKHTSTHDTFLFLFFSLSLPLPSSFLSVISIKATNDNAASSNFDWSHTFDTHTFFFFSFFFFYDSPCFSLSSASSIVCVSSSSFFFRAYRHRAYQWNFRTAADASGDDINTHIVLFITSGFLLDRNLRCIHTHTYTHIHTHTIEQIQFSLFVWWAKTLTSN
jgi:hypothetical protein